MNITARSTAAHAARLLQIQSEAAGLASRRESLAKVKLAPTAADERRLEALEAWEIVLELTVMDGSTESAAVFATKLSTTPVKARAFPLAIAWAEKAFSLRVCSKCSGSGRHRSMVAGGVCFGCNGKGFF